LEPPRSVANPGKPGDAQDMASRDKMSLTISNRELCESIQQFQLSSRFLCSPFVLPADAWQFTIRTWFLEIV
jgi:hypothetical protein